MVSFKNVCCTLCYFLISLSLFAQPASIVPQNQNNKVNIPQLTFDNQYLLKFSQHTTMENVTSFLNKYPYSEIEVVDINWQLYSLKTLNDTHYGTFGSFIYPSKFEMLNELKQSKLFDVVQITHPVVKRKVPNDQYLSKQYYLSLTKNYNVWENSIGGIDKNGDTVVVAVIDDGVDTSHEDLIPNLWVNRNEIPYNGIDDDNNGFRDDYRGWNGGDQSPFIFNGESIIDGHGTCVAGVLGAKGNNTKGIVGSNWNIKIMPILCYPSDPTADGELAVIRSMSYAFKMKQLFLRSNKTKGANIVAVNMSVGMDNAFADDAPIWCSLYDSLGSVGIVSVCAATNRNVDVAVSGDIPTLCGSKYLITVSNSDDLDQHVSSGYSKVYVDLSAPGENIYTTSPNKLGFPYKEENGTSFASPQVAGAVSLLYTTSCKVYLDLYKSNPDSAIRLMKSWILNRVDTNSSLKSTTFSGGRLNTLGAWQALDSWCWKNDPIYTRTKTVKSKHFKLFPNPTSGNCYLESNFPGEFSYKVVNLLGQSMCEGKNFHGKAEIQLNLLPGNYVIYFEGQWGREEEKLLVLD